VPGDTSGFGGNANFRKPKEREKTTQKGRGGEKESRECGITIVKGDLVTSYYRKILNDQKRI